MAINGLKIIGESINDSVPSTNTLFDSDDISSCTQGIQELARFQEENGAAFIDVNVGGRTAPFMADMVRAVLDATTVPLSIDSPDKELAGAGLAAYDDSRGKPILNSISPLRMEMFDLYDIKPFRPILLISEFIDSDGQGQSATTPDETFQAAVSLFEAAKKRGIPNDDIIFDPGIAPIASDTEGHLFRILEVLARIQAEPSMAGVHASVGLSNFTVGLPPKTRKSALNVKGPLESAFLTLAMPRGLDHVIGSVKRKYQLLTDNHPALQCVRDCIALGGFESLARVRTFYVN
ncbi:MAG: dihydropteroate synthase [Thermoguttaceae bacterium]|nr:dihydropteroate synthase [Thermoguttaceae bacterium]